MTKSRNLSVLIIEPS